MRAVQYSSASGRARGPSSFGRRVHASSSALCVANKMVFFSTHAGLPGQEGNSAEAKGKHGSRARLRHRRHDHPPTHRAHLVQMQHSLSLCVWWQASGNSALRRGRRNSIDGFVCATACGACYSCSCRGIDMNGGGRCTMRGTQHGLLRALPLPMRRCHQRLVSSAWTRTAAMLLLLRSTGPPSCGQA